MRYGLILKRSWTLLRHTGELWRLLLAVAVGYVPAALAAVWAVRIFARDLPVAVLAEEAVAPLPLALASLDGYVALLAAALLAMVPYVFMEAGAVAIADAAAVGVRAGLGAAWQITRGALPRLAGFYTYVGAIGLVGYVLYLATMLPTLAGATGGPDAAAAPAAVASLLVPVAWLVMAVLGVVLGIVGALGVRAVVLDGATGARAFTWAFSTLRARAGSCLAMLGVLYLVQYVYSMALSFVITPCAFIAVLGSVSSTMTSGAIEPGPLFAGIAVLTGVTMLLTVPALLYGSIAWTLFYRSLLGRPIEEGSGPARIEGYPEEGGERG